MQIRLRDYGVLDFDARDARRQPPVDTTWQQVYIDLLMIYLLSVVGYLELLIFFFSNTDLFLLKNRVL